MRARPPFPEVGSLSEPDRLRAALREIGQRSHRDSQRLRPVQELCVAGIERRNGPECVAELPVASLYAEDVWDVATPALDEPLLCISAKAMASSRHHNIGNRLREMCGEAASLRARQPDAVLGYLCLIASDEPGRIGGRESRHSDDSIAEAVGRRCGDIARHRHHFDVGCVLRVDLASGDYYSLRAEGLYPFAQFLDELTKRWEMRAAGQSRQLRPEPASRR